jgi:hypothetical protein
MDHEDRCAASRTQHLRGRLQHTARFNLLRKGRGEARRPGDAQAHLIINQDKRGAIELADSSILRFNDHVQTPISSAEQH